MGTFWKGTAPECRLRGLIDILNTIINGNKTNLSSKYRFFFIYFFAVMPYGKNHFGFPKKTLGEQFLK